MPEDHYVAKTYLRHFVGQSGMLRAYRKSDGATFPCWPRDICKELDGDHIPDFLTVPTYLGDYRAEFEPAWNHAVEALKRREFDRGHKLAIAGYWAQLLVCTPAWTRVGTEIFNQNTQHAVASHCEISARHGRPDELLQSAVDAVAKGEIKLETERDYVRAQSASMVLKFAWALYNAHWSVLENDTDVEFLTSDNPASFEDQGDHWAPPGVRTPFTRYLPVTPRLCLMCDLTQSPAAVINAREYDFSLEPLRKINGGSVGREVVDRVNSWIVKCAESLVLGSAGTEYARNLTASYANFRIETESKRFQAPKGFLIANRTRCIERRPST